MRFLLLSFRTHFRQTFSCLVFMLLFQVLGGQVEDTVPAINNVSDQKARKDSTLELTPKSVVVFEPDTNFTFEKYGKFLNKISDRDKYVVVPINEFRKTFDNTKIVIGLRHDVDENLDHALLFSETEWKSGFRSTYYILHTAPYYLLNPNDKAVHNEGIIQILQRMQEERHFEIGWHNDLVTLQVVYNIDPVIFLHNELAWLRSFGLNIKGTASHGSPYCKTYHYLNYYFFPECSTPVVTGFENTNSLQKNGQLITFQKGALADFGLDYEAYFLNNNKYFSDASFINGARWHIGMLDLDQLVPGDRVIILVHPIHWHKASVSAEILAFSVTGQESSSVQSATRSVSALMPYGTDLTALKPFFKLSPGAYAKVNGTTQTSGSTANNFTTPLIYKVFSENRDVSVNWTVDIRCRKNSAASFTSFMVPGATRAVRIDPASRYILLELAPGTDLSSVPVQFELSPGATAWIGGMEQFSNSGSVDLNRDIVFKVLAEDGITSSLWTVSASFTTNELPQPEEKFTVYPNPSDGLLHLQFRDIVSPQSRIEIFSLAGDKIYDEIFNKTGSFTIDVDLTNEPPGLYIVRNLNTGQRILVVIQ